MRAELLRAVFETLTARTEDIAALVTAEGGKPLAESRAEVAYGADYVRWYSEQAVRFEGLARRAPSGANHQLVLRRPVGPALLITPWNFPIAMIARKVAPALAAGCTVVIKPAQLTPLTTAYVAEIIREELEGRGLPTGVINVVPSASARTISGPLLADPRLRKLSFTGSTEVGAALLKASADNILRTSMELGGNAPFLVFEDADIPAAVQGAVQAKMRNAGQTCVAANRFLVHASVAEEFTAGLTEAFDKLVVGHGADEGTTVGPLIESSAVDRVEEVVAEAVDAGARVRIGGDRPDRPGLLLRADRPRPRLRRPARDHRGDLRPGRPRGDVRLRGRGGRAGELDAVRARRLRVHARHRPGDAPGGVGGDRDARREPRAGVRRERAVRRREVVRAWGARAARPASRSISTACTWRSRRGTPVPQLPA